MADQNVEINILEIDDKHVWLCVEVDGKLYYKQPLAAAFRRYLEPEYQKDLAESGGWNTEQAFAKMRIMRAIESEIQIA